LLQELAAQVCRLQQHLVVQLPLKAEEASLIMLLHLAADTVVAGPQDLIMPAQADLAAAAVLLIAEQAALVPPIKGSLAQVVEILGEVVVLAALELLKHYLILH
jgi:hypothetical protein